MLAKVCVPSSDHTFFKPKEIYRVHASTVIHFNIFTYCVVGYK